jgi:hypothetical protein
MHKIILQSFISLFVWIPTAQANQEEPLYVQHLSQGLFPTLKEFIDAPIEMRRVRRTYFAFPYHLSNTQLHFVISDTESVELPCGPETLRLAIMQEELSFLSSHAERHIVEALNQMDQMRSQLHCSEIEERNTHRQNCEKWMATQGSIFDALNEYYNSTTQPARPLPPLFSMQGLFSDQFAALVANDIHNRFSQLYVDNECQMEILRDEALVSDTLIQCSLLNRYREHLNPWTDPHQRMSLTNALYREYPRVQEDYQLCLDRQN